MCTALLEFDPDGPVPVTLAANRDEFRDRPWEGPLQLEPGIFGGRDLRSGGTWLCIGRNSLALITNIKTATVRDDAPSRGTLPILAVRGELPREFDEFNPFNLLTVDVVADRARARVVTHRGGGRPAEIREFGMGRYVISNVPFGAVPDLRTTAAATFLRDQEPNFEILSHHGTAASQGSAICLHGDRYGTTSAARIVLGPGLALVSFQHKAALPCTSEVEDLTTEAREALVQG